MAATAVTLVIDKLNLLLTQEVKLLRGVHREFADVKDELESIRSFLRDADAKLQREDVNEGMKTWLKQVREAAYHIEDVIDEYMLHVARHRDQHGFKGFLHKLPHLVKKLKLRHDIAFEIKVIKASVREIKERRERYGFSPSEQGGSSSDANNERYDPHTVGSLFIDEAELMGIESPRDELVSKLVDGASTRTVVSVVGMGGVGKTTLAKKVYDDQRVNTHFDCHAWITVSQSYSIEELLRSIIRQFYQSRMEAAPLEIDTMNNMLLNGKLREFLQQKMYVIVFDDVWKVDFWGEIEYALLDNNNCSRIIITTRDEDVANSCKKSANLHIHKQKPLSPEMAWELFCRKAFRHDGHCPPGLEKLSSDIVERCGGLPLAIVAVGGLMSIKGTDVSEWRNLLDSLSLELESNPHLTSIKRILTFSYLDLPYHIKSCYLYFGMFPEDCSISCSRLMLLWIANGLIKKTAGVTAEAVAEKYLTELIHRSLVQVAELKLDGKVKRCRVHDLLREVILSRSEELSFSQVSIENYLVHNRIARHLSICERGNNISETVSRFQTRSIMLFNVVDELPNQVIRPFFANLKLLNVLDFEGAPLDYIPEELGNLLCLSYLSIRRTKVKALPKSVGKLLNLETLDLRQSLVDKLPVEINKFPNLRYLLVYFHNFDIEYNINFRRGIKIQGSVGCLKALQKLYTLDIEHASMKSISELGNLTQLRKLGIKKLKRENGMALSKALEKMTHLESLAVSATSEMEFLELQSISSPPLLLQRLRLHGRLEKLPAWIQKLKSLVSISMCWSRLMDDSLNVLEALPNLLDLRFYDGYDGDQLHFEKGRFQKLKRLYLRRLSRLNKLNIDQGALPLLEELVIGPSPELKEVPSAIQHLRNLQLIRFDDMSKEFALSVVPHQGPDHSKVEHIPSVHFCYTDHGALMRPYDLRNDIDNSALLKFLQS